MSSVASRAAELERLGEERQDPESLVRAARLYTLAVRILDDIDRREALPFMRSDLARVRDELRTLATAGSVGVVTHMFREIAVRIEQRLSEDEV